MGVKCNLGDVTTQDNAGHWSHSLNLKDSSRGFHRASANLGSGPILAVLIHSLLSGHTFCFALPAGMLFTKRNKNRA